MRLRLRSQLIHTRQLFFLRLRLQIGQFLHLLIHGVHLPLHIGKRELHLGERLFQVLAVLFLLFQRGLGIELRLGHFLDKHLTDFHLRNIPALHDLFLDLLDELRSDRLFLLRSDLIHLARIRLDQALKDRIVRDHIDIHL